MSNILPVQPEEAEGNQTQPGESLKYGANNEKLKDLNPELAKRLVTLCRRLQARAAEGRRYQIRQAMEARYFWRSMHYLWWSDQERRFKVLGRDQMPKSVAAPRFRHVTNIYQHYGLAFMTLVSESKIKVRIWPQDPRQQDDLDTAEAGTTIAEYLERINDFELLSIREAQLMYQDGFCAWYVRHEIDGETYGYDHLPVVEEQVVPAGEPVLECPQCGAITTPMPGPSVGQPCEGCGAELDAIEDRRVPPNVRVPMQVGENVIPRGQERFTVHSILEVSTPPDATEQKEFSHLLYATEIHRAKLTATYPHMREEIRNYTGADMGTQHDPTRQYDASEGAADEMWERTQRMLARNPASGSDAIQDAGLLTFNRMWVRPWTFHEMESETAEDKAYVAEAMELFPQGAYVAYFGDKHVESRNEKLDDYWHIVHPLPGEGQDREAVGRNMMSIQRRHTTIDNLQMETYQRGIGQTFIRSEAINAPGLEKSPNLPGGIRKIAVRMNMRAGDEVYDSRPSTVSPQAIEHQRELWGPISQHAVGTYPAAYGGDLGGNDTARGIIQQTTQAKGRMGLIYRAIRAARPQIMVKGIECFRKHRADDTEVALFDPAARAFKAKTIKLVELSGAINAYPESDEPFPASWAEQQAQIFALLENPALMAAAATPETITEIQRLSGLHGIKFVGVDARSKQMREIEQLLEDGAMGRGPVLVPAQVDPMTGAPALKPDGQLSMPTFEPSVPIDELLDDHPAEFAAIQSWSNSDAGQLARIQNPAGFLNVKLHGAKHKMIVDMLAMQAAMMEGAMKPGGAGNPSKGDSGKKPSNEEAA